MQFDLDYDESATEHQPDDSLTTDSSGHFEYVPNGIPYGTEVTVAARVMQWDDDLGNDSSNVGGYRVGPWNPYTFKWQDDAPPGITGFTLAEGAPGTGPTASGDLSTNAQYGANVRIEFSYTTDEDDWPDDPDNGPEPDAYTWTDADGHFEYTIPDLQRGAYVKIKAHVCRLDSLPEDYSSWTAIESFQFDDMPLATVHSLTLNNPSGEYDGDLVSDPTLAGQVGGSSGEPIDYIDVQIDCGGDGGGDDDSPGFAISGTGVDWYAIDSPMGYQGDYRHRDSANAKTPTWTIDDLTDGKRYEVLTTWNPDAGNRRRSAIGQRHR